MNTRTITSQVVFQHPFCLPGMAEPQPPGAYAITTDQEELQGITFITFRTVAVFLRLPAIGTCASQVRQLPIHLDDLDACVRSDRTMKKARALPAP